MKMESDAVDVLLGEAQPDEWDHEAPVETREFHRGTGSRVLRKGRRVYGFEVLGPTRTGRGGAPGKRDYLCKCVCGAQVWVPYLALYNGSARNCGCREWYKHPPINLEHTAEGTLDVLDWDADQGGWRCVCRECGCILLGKSAAEVRLLGAAGCEAHTRAQIDSPSSPR